MEPEVSPLDLIDSNAEPRAAPRSFRIAAARPSDQGVFLHLWRHYLTEQLALGGDIPPTDENLREYLRIFDSYVGGWMHGGVLIAWSSGGEPVGVLLGGERPGGWDLRSSRGGRVAWLLGVYVTPEWRRRGVAWALQDAAHTECRRLGFTEMQSTVVSGYTGGERNALGWGAQVVASVIRFDISEPGGVARRKKDESHPEQESPSGRS